MSHPIDLDRSLNKPKDMLRLMRPLHWIKNAFVFTGFVFGSFYNDWGMLLNVLLVAISFCLISSSVYIINDIIDVEKDIVHPLKRKRPIASGAVSVRAATILLGILGIAGLVLGFWVSFIVGILQVIYIVMNISYSYILKEIVILDVFCISLGFMLRILAGTIGVGIPPSQWLLLCGLMLTLFLGFSKRRAELFLVNKEDQKQRKVLESYGSIFLDELITICATGAILSFSLYTMSEQTIQFHNTNKLIYTVPFVVFAIFRYLYLLNHCALGEDPSRDLVKDPHIVISVLAWSFVTLYILNVA